MEKGEKIREKDCADDDGTHKKRGMTAGAKTAALSSRWE
jgi:hypothetical protein